LILTIFAVKLELILLSSEVQLIVVCPTLIDYL